MKKLSSLAVITALLIGSMVLIGCPTDSNKIEDEPVSLIGKVVINEVYSFGDQGTLETLDWFELYNKSDEELDLGGLLMWDSGGSARAWTFPTGKKIGPLSRLVIVCDGEGLLGDPLNHPAFGFSKGPDEYVVLAYPDLTEIDRVKLPSMNNTESYGRVTDGADAWQVFQHHTRGEPNTGPAREGITNTTGIWINEVYTDNTTGITYAGKDDEDFIELYNSNDQPVDISGWILFEDNPSTGNVFTILPGTIVPANGYLVFNVRNRYDPNRNPPGDGSMPWFGLGVGGDWVFLHKPPVTQEGDWWSSGELVDVMEIPGLSLRGQGYTYGRDEDGSLDLTWFEVGSPGESNNGKEKLIIP